MSNESVNLVSNWMNVDLFTVEQAAALWIGIDPSTTMAVDSLNPPEYLATKQMLVAAIISGELSADTSTNALRIIGDHNRSLVSRESLEGFARKRELFPAFLFNTLAPFDASVSILGIRRTVTGHQSNSATSSTSINHGGRPPQYDWDTFVLEVIRRANLPDGLPDKQADLVRDMLSWFQDKYSAEPAESAVKSRISKIYRYLSEAKNSSE